MATAIEPINTSGESIAAQMLVAIQTRIAAGHGKSAPEAEGGTARVKELAANDEESGIMPDSIFDTAWPVDLRAEQADVLPPRPILDMAREAYEQLRVLMERTETGGT